MSDSFNNYIAALLRHVMRAAIGEAQRRTRDGGRRLSPDCRRALLISASVAPGR